MPTGDLLDLDSPTPSAEWGDGTDTSPSRLETSTVTPPHHHFADVDAIDELDTWASSPGTVEDLDVWATSPPDVRSQPVRPSDLYGDPFSSHEYDLWQDTHNSDFR